MPLLIKIMAALGTLGFALAIGILAREVYWFIQIGLWGPPRVGDVLSWVELPTPGTGWLQADLVLWRVYSGDAILVLTLGIPAVALAVLFVHRERERPRP